jgi:hypothetical protein
MTTRTRQLDPRRQGVGRPYWRLLMLHNLAGLTSSLGAGRARPPVHGVVPFGFRHGPSLVPTSNGVLLNCLAARANKPALSSCPSIVFAHWLAGI